MTNVVARRVKPDEVSHGAMATQSPHFRRLLRRSLSLTPRNDMRYLFYEHADMIRHRAFLPRDVIVHQLVHCARFTVHAFDDH